MVELNKYKNINEALIDYVKNIDKFESNIKIKINYNNINYDNESQTSIFKLAKKNYAINNKGKVLNNGEYIYVSNADIKESIAKTLRSLEQKIFIAEHLEIFNSLDEIIENGVLIAKADETKDRKQYKNWNYYITFIKIDGKNYIVQFDVVMRENNQKHCRLVRLYSFQK